MNNLYIYDFLGYVSVILSMFAFLEKKDATKMLFWGMASAMFFSISLIGYGGFNGVVVAAFSIVIKGAVLYYKKAPVIYLKVISLLMSILYFVYFNNEGLFGIIPASTIIIVAFADTQDSLVKMKIWYIPSALLWLVYAIHLESPSAVIYDIVGLMALGYVLLRHGNTAVAASRRVE